MAGLPLEQSEDRVDISLRASFQIPSIFDELIVLVRGSGLAGNIGLASAGRAALEEIHGQVSAGHHADYQDGVRKVFDGVGAGPLGDPSVKARCVRPA